MTTTARITAKKAADTSYTFSVASGVTAQFAAISLTGSEFVLIEIADSSGNYHSLYFDDGEHGFKQALMKARKNTISITGPVDARINKPTTANTVEIVEYT